MLFFLSSAQAGVRVELSGLDGAERANVETRLTIRQQAGRQDLDQSLVERLHQQASADIREALQPYGYYTPEIEAELTGQAPDWTARYRVSRGPETRLAVVDVQLVGEGAQQKVFQDALRRLRRRLSEGDRLQHSNYQAAKSALADAAYASGFLDAHWIESRLQVNPDTRQAEVVLKFDTGPRYYIGEVRLEQEGLDAEFIESYITLRPGQPFDPQELLDQQFALSDLGYFQSVEIEPQRERAGPDHRVPLLIRTTPRNRSRYEVGLGYGTDTGARLSLGMERRRLNRYGHHFDGNMRLSEIKNTAAAGYHIPFGDEPGEDLAFTLLTESEKLEDGETQRYVVGASLNRHPGDWQRRFYLEYTHEESELGSQVATADLLTPGLSLTRTEADDPIYARRGWYLFADVHGAEKDILANTRFVRSHVQTRGVYALDRRTRALGRVDLGANFVEDFEELPASQRFFAGGDQSVRGYDYQSIGGRDARGEVVGGEYLASFSAELERRIKGNWGAAVFLDGGGADSEFLPAMFYGAGVGLRYRAPVGSLQLDLAHPLSGDEDGQFLGIRVHIGVRVGL